MTARRQFVVGAIAVVLALASGIYIGIEARGGPEASVVEAPEGALTSEAIVNLFAARLNDAEGKTPVSYTHLDVYKRQDLHR